MSLFLLAVAFVFSGVNAILSQALIEMGLVRYLNFYMVALYGSGVVLSLIVCVITRHRIGAKDIAVGLFMGLTSAVTILTLMLALKGMDGVVAFSVRSCGNIALTAGFSLMIWRERISLSQWAGIACAVAAIYLLL